MRMNSTFHYKGLVGLFEVIITLFICKDFIQLTYLQDGLLLNLTYLKFLSGVRVPCECTEPI